MLTVRFLKGCGVIVDMKRNLWNFSNALASLMLTVICHDLMVVTHCVKNLSNLDWLFVVMKQSDIHVFLMILID